MQTWNLRDIDAPGGSRSPVVLRSDDQARAVLIALEPGQELGEQTDRSDQRLPVASRQVDSPDRAGEEEVAGEERPGGVIGEMRGRVARDADRLERDPSQLERLVALEQDVGGVRAQRKLGRREVLDVLERDAFDCSHVHRRAGRVRQVGDAA